MKNSEQKIIEEAQRMRDHAYAPYSHFKVGCAVITKNGNIYSGANIENASFSLTCCAERVAIFSAVADGNQEFSSIAIATYDKNVITPCGACRQVMAEFFPKDISIHLINGDNDRKTITFEDIFPNPFDPASKIGKN